MKNRITKVLALVLIAAGLIATSGCDVNVPEKNYTVSFYMNGHGSQIESQTVKEGENAVRPADPVEEGQVFGGWFTDSECSGTEFDFGTAIKSDIQLFAKWTTSLCFTAGTGGATVSMAKEGDGWNIPEVQYSTDRVTWSDFTIGTTSVTLNAGDKVYFKGNNPNGFNNSMMDYVKFVLAGSVAASGNVMSLVDSDCKTTTIPNNYCFANLFEGCTSLTAAPVLPATTLTVSCYYEMFSGCTSLTTAPALPATTLAVSCYDCMFGGCTTLTAAPELKATTLAEGCYSYMFYGCTSLTEAPELPTTTLAESCYSSMFKACTSLTAAPALKATTLADWCYSYMFAGCTKLSSLNVSFTAWKENATYDWLKNAGTDVSETKTFTCPASLDTSTHDVSHVPGDWTIITK